METLNKLQIDLNEKINRGLVNFKKSPKDRITTSYIETRLDALESQWLLFNDTHRQIVTEIADDEMKKSTYYKNSLYDLTEDIYFGYKTELKQTLCDISRNVKQTESLSAVCSNGNHSNSHYFSFKLPKISIPIFSGNYTEWVTFRDLYMSLIHNNTTLDDVQKLHYLKGQLTGEAEQLVRHIPISSSSYASCWKKLQDRYDNKRYLTNNIFKRLIGHKSLQSESSSGIKELLDTICDCLQGLNNLGVSTESWDLIIIYLMSQKLDPESRKQWESKSCELGGDLPTLDSFKVFLDHKFKSLEFLDARFKYQKGVNIHSVSTDNPDIENVNTVQSACIICPFCKGEHRLITCKMFLEKDYNSRHNFVQTSRLCFNCLGNNHAVYMCRQSSRCRICKRKHHSLLHPPKGFESNAINNEGSPVSGEALVSTATEVQDKTNENIITACFAKISGRKLLPTAVTQAKTQRGDFFLRCLLDQGSEASFVTEATVQALGLKKVPKNTLISGVEKNISTSKYVVSIELKSIHDPNFAIQVEAHVLGKLTRFLPSKEVSVGIWPGLAEFKLADPNFDKPNKIDMILGVEIYSQIVEGEILKGPPGVSLLAQNTKFGWILSGCISTNETPETSLCSAVMNTYVEDVEESNDLLKKFWEIEGDNYKNKEKILSPEEERCEEIFRQSTSRDESGRYIVKLPFRDNDPQCQYNGSQYIAKRSLNFLDKRLNENPELRRQYASVIKEYEELGHAEVIPVDEQNDTRSVYLPHHAVVRADKSTTRVRVVFNGSARGKNGVSLNDNLMIGAPLQPNLRHTVMRWRQHRICLIADIVKMYRQVKVANEDTNFQRIMWRDELGNLIHYRLLRVTFGIASAPYLAVRALQQAAYDESEGFEHMILQSGRRSKGGKISKEIAGRIISDFYMDDLMTGCSSLEEGLKVYNEITEALKKAGFELQKWMSNSKRLMSIVGKNATDNKGKEKLLKLGIEDVVQNVRKVLGITWNSDTDEIQYSVQLPQISIPVTKRKVISSISMLFDPLGWIAPVIIQAKIFIQKLWLSGINWDDELPTELLKEWLAYQGDLLQLTSFCIPRWIYTHPHCQEIELHGFCDASNSAYAAVVYIRTKSVSGEIKVSIVTAKTKVAPVKQISVPRLELCGAVLLANLLLEVTEILKIKKKDVHAWTDSSVVLAWLSSHPSRWKTFVGNRVSEVISLYDRGHWSHVRSKDNPADCASRGINPKEISNLKLWVSGPSWLYDSQIKYSPLSESSQVGDTDLEERDNPHICCVTTQEEEAVELFSRFSSLRRFVRVLSYCRRFIKLKCNKSKPKFEAWLTHAELQETLMICIRKYQSHHYKREISDIKGNGFVSRQSNLYSLSPFLDRSNILRVGGRLRQSDLSFDMKHPILVPHDCHLANLIIADAHTRTLHGGCQAVMNYIRTKYWMIRLKSQVKLFARCCIVCIRHNAKAMHPLMGQLPSARVTACRPFKHSGVDYAGPIALRATKGRGHHATKGYICLFICMATKAIHLEVVSDMTSAGFLAAFKRFVARRGHCAELWSDNGSNFIGASRELKALFTKEKSSVAAEIAEWLASNGTNWHMIPPYAPHFGGLWEAGIKSTKYHLKRTIGTSTLTFEELSTVLAQIEACLNSRPISRLSDNIEDTVPLTPGHFLVGEQLLLVPDVNYEKSNFASLRRWQLTQRMVQNFWRRWSQEYLNGFLRRYKWNEQIPEPDIGDVVLVMENDLPPARWLCGVIVDKHPGLDGVTRVVTLRCKDSHIKRPVSKLCSLPVKSKFE